MALSSKQKNVVTTQLKKVEKVELATTGEFFKAIDAFEKDMYKLASTAIDPALIKPQITLNLRKAGYFKNVNKYVGGTYQQIIDDSFNTYKVLANKAFAFSPESLNKIGTMKAIDVQQFSQLGEQAITSYTNMMLSKQITASSATNLIENIAKTADTFRNHAQTWVATSTSALYRESNTLLAQDNGIEQFEYVGVLDSLTRDFCAEHLGEVKTVDEWNALDNGQIGPVSIYLGGYNCRHSLIGVVSGF